MWCCVSCDQTSRSGWLTHSSGPVYRTVELLLCPGVCWCWTLLLQFKYTCNVGSSYTVATCIRYSLTGLWMDFNTNSKRCWYIAVLKYSRLLFCSEFVGPALGGFLLDAIGFGWMTTIVAGACLLLVGLIQSIAMYCVLLNYCNRRNLNLIFCLYQVCTKTNICTSLYTSASSLALKGSFLCEQ